MEIIIRTDGSETVVRPGVTSSQSDRSGAEQAAPPEAIAAKAAAMGASNAGPAPSPPDLAGAPPVNVASTEQLAAPTGDAGESAGAAPVLD